MRQNFKLTEEDRKSIRRLHGLNEQTIALSLPISDTFTSYDCDSAHNLKGFEKKIDAALEQIYKQGINPKMYDLNFQVVRNGNTFTTTSSLIIKESDDGKAWTGFASRGSCGDNYVKRADGQIDGSTNQDGKSLKEKLQSKADAVEIIPISNSPIIINNVQIKQYFFQFTKSLKPSHTSTKPLPKEEEKPELITIKAYDLENLENEFNKKNYESLSKIEEKYKLYDFKILGVSQTTGEVNISFSKVKDPNGYKGFFLFFIPKVGTKSDLQKYNDDLSEKMNLEQETKTIETGTLNWLGSDWDYSIVGHN